MELTLNHGEGTMRPRKVNVTAADALGIAYEWSFRGSPREDFAPWSAVHMISLKHGPSKEFPPKSWAKTFKKSKPAGATGMVVVGKNCEVMIRDLGTDDTEKVTTIKGYVQTIDDQAAMIVHNRFGQVYQSTIPLTHVVNIEYREKKDTKPPGVA